MRHRGLSLLEMLVALAIAGLGVAAAYRSIGSSASHTWQLRQRQQAWLVLQGMLETPADGVPGDLPYTEQRGGLTWSIETVADQPPPTIEPLFEQPLLQPSPRVQPVALRYRVQWDDGQRSIEVLTWRLAPREPQPRRP